MKQIRVLIAAIIGIIAAPVVADAQETNKEFYLRPSYWRPYDQRGINVFETTKEADTIPYEGLRVRFGAGFTQGFQGLKHQNNFTSAPTEPNRLYPMTPGFNIASANLNLDVQLADGIRLNLTTYLASRHHNETWVKGGYIQMDKLPFKGEIWKNLMKNTTIKMGHMEINYGDAHFRRTDGGQAIFNPFVENNIIDAFATEIGGEFIWQKNGILGVFGVTNGMIKGSIDSLVKTAQDDNVRKSPAFYAKVGFDKNVTGKVRLRATASAYHNGSSGGNTLFAGDRTGSHYVMAMEKAGGSYTANFTSGRVNPGFSKKVDAVQLNGFVKAGGLELSGMYETAQGRTKTEINDRKFSQFAGDVVYRFGPGEKLFAGVKYNTVRAELQGFTNDVSVSRFAAGAGWFLTKNLLIKGELVNQQYKDFPANDYRNGGKIKGYVIEAVVGF